jgi:hydrogenase maturation protein HypF
MGRLFDAVSSLIGVRQQVNYEGQAAIELEAITDPDERGIYHFDILQETNSPIRISSVPLIHSVINDLRCGVSPGVISARFHNGVAVLISEICQQLKRECDLNQVALSGGVFQNVTLLDKTLKLLTKAGFKVFTHHLVPPNDGGIALGQAAVAQFMVK